MSPLEKRFKILYHLVLALGADDVVKSLEELLMEGLSDASIEKYEDQVLGILENPERLGISRTVN